MEVTIHTKQVQDRTFYVLKSDGAFHLAHEVIEVHPRFKPCYHTLSDKYFLLTDECIIATSSTREFKCVSKALDTFKAA